MMQRITILIVYSDVTELSLMAAALADSYDVISACNMKEALFFLKRHPPCRVAYFEIGSDTESAVKNMRLLGKKGMEIIALFRPPCPKLVRKEIRDGYIRGLCKLPINLKSFTTHVHKLTSKLFIKKKFDPSHFRILTKEELDFILNFTIEDV